MRIILRIFCFMFGHLLFLPTLLFLRVFVNILQVSYLRFCSFNDCNSPSCSAFFHFHINIDKDADCRQSNNNVFSNDLWLVLSTSVLFLKVWFNKTSNMKLRLFVFLIFYLLLFCIRKLKLLIIMKLQELIVDMNFLHLTTSVLVRIFKH